MGNAHQATVRLPRRDALRCGFVAALLIVAVSSGCNAPRGESFDEIAPGMPQEEVRAILGEPSSRRIVPEADQDAIGYSERWQYGDTLSSLATDAVFPDAPDSRVYVVFFDSAGHVIDTRRPQPDESVWQPSWQDQSPFDR